MAEIENKVAPSEAKAPAQDNKFAPRGNRNAHGNSNNRGGRPNGGRRFNGRRDEIEYEEKIVKISKVSKTVKGGKRMRFTALSVIGDKKGKYGFGLGKSTEVPEAIKKSLASSKRNMFHVAVSKGDTIAHTVIGKFGATSVFLKPAPEGTGLVAGGAVRAILELAGVRNVYSKIYGSRTKSNVIKATVDGLKQLKNINNVQAVRYGKEAAKEAEKAPEAK